MQHAIHNRSTYNNLLRFLRVPELVTAPLRCYWGGRDRLDLGLITLREYEFRVRTP